MDTVQRINKLTHERQELFSQASNGRRGDPKVTARIKAIAAELDQLWEVRRKERAGQVDGIDAVVDAVYRHTYGENYEESVRPAPVQEPSNDPALAAA